MYCVSCAVQGVGGEHVYFHVCRITNVWDFTKLSSACCWHSACVARSLLQPASLRLPSALNQDCQ